MVRELLAFVLRFVPVSNALDQFVSTPCDGGLGLLCTLSECCRLCSAHQASLSIYAAYAFLCIVSKSCMRASAN